MVSIWTSLYIRLLVKSSFTKISWLVHINRSSIKKMTSVSDRVEKIADGKKKSGFLHFFPLFFSKAFMFTAIGFNGEKVKENIVGKGE